MQTLMPAKPPALALKGQDGAEFVSLPQCGPLTICSVSKEAAALQEPSLIGPSAPIAVAPKGRTNFVGFVCRFRGCVIVVLVAGSRL
jgi:hypothetical protein